MCSQVNMHSGSVWFGQVLCEFCFLIITGVLIISSELPQKSPTILAIPSTMLFHFNRYFLSTFHKTPRYALVPGWGVGGGVQCWGWRASCGRVPQSKTWTLMWSLLTKKELTIFCISHVYVYYMYVC